MAGSLAIIFSATAINLQQSLATRWGNTHFPPTTGGCQMVADESLGLCVTMSTLLHVQWCDSSRHIVSDHVFKTQHATITQHIA